MKRRIRKIDQNIHIHKKILKYEVLGEWRGRFLGLGALKKVSRIRRGCGIRILKFRKPLVHSPCKNQSLD